MEYRHIISLGFFCSVASELERVGLRSCSSPLDWVISDFKSLEYIFDKKIDCFLEIDFLYQYKENKSIYYNKKYGIAFYHDFNKNECLDKQISMIKEKYDRRFTQFYENIKHPTLFCRYIRNEEELVYIEKNIEDFKTKIKKYNDKNDIIFIANNDLKSSKITLYSVTKDKDDSVARRFLDSNVDLYNLLTDENVYSPEIRKKNLKMYIDKKKKEKRFLNKYKYKIKKIINSKTKKIYTHKRTIEHKNAL